MHRRTRSRAIAPAAAPLALGFALALPMTGCYQRVTKARGIGTEEYTVYESAEESRLIPPKDDSQIPPERRAR